MRTPGTVLGAVFCMGMLAGAKADDTMMIYYDFTEGGGTTLHDKSGNGNDAAIHGASWVKSDGLWALALDGVDDYVDCGGEKATDVTDAITVEVWAFPKKAPPAGEAGIVGKDFGSYVLTHHRDGCWWYISGGGNNCKSPLSAGAWHHIVGTFDGTMIRLYVDGSLKDSRLSKERAIRHGKHLFIGKSEGSVKYTRNAHFNGLIGEVRLYDRALSGEEVMKHYRTTRLTHRMDVSASVGFFSREVTATLNLRGMGELPQGAALQVELWPAGGERPIQKREVKDITSWSALDVTLPPANLAEGRYELRARVVDATGKPIGSQAVAEVTWPAAPSWPGVTGARVLNNFVTELLSVGEQPPQPRSDHAFVNPRDGWVFISSTAEVKDAEKIRVTLDEAADAVITHEKGKPQVLEAMRRLPRGDHKVTIKCEGAAAVKALVVRAIPEIIYCRFQSDPHVKEYGPYDAAFLKTHVFPHINCIVGARDSGKRPYELRAFVEEWKRDGKKWLIECGVPGLGSEKPITGDEAYAYWSGNAAFQDPLLDGIIADEFGAGEQEQYVAWTEAVERIYKNPKFAGKEFIPYCAPMYGAKRSEAFMQAVLGAGYPFAFERYMKEQPTEADGRKYLESSLRGTMLSWREAFPGAEKRAIICLGYLCAPPESLNTDPSVNYKVFMDMQFHLIANDLAFWGIHGIMEYLSSYADEEAVRWAAKLYRHYCIEGKTERLSKDPYRLDHIENPDFADGLRGWTLAPAEEGSITAGTLSGYGWLQGRYPRTNEGDTFLCTRRCAAKPNTFSQEIRRLQPGRLYSLKMFTADRKDLAEGRSAQQKHAVTICLENVEVIPGRSFQHVFPNCYSHHSGPFDKTSKAWMNFHWMVFRATSDRARIAVSDWASDAEAGGAIGQELMFNFIEIQPYLE